MVSGGPEGPRYSDFSDLDLKRWKEHSDLILGSLWLLGARDHSGPHEGDYWGNFVPQIAQQVLRRFTRPGEVVVDLFCGMGTTLIECRRLGRHGIGVELNAAVARRATERIERAENPLDIETRVLIGDAASPQTLADLRAELAAAGRQYADCLILHPPYHDIIKFSDDPRDLCNAPNERAFLEMFRRVVATAVALLAPRRFLTLVIGDKYRRGEWVPLGFQCMQICREAGLQLKAINVKDIQGNERGKGKNENLWKYRALKDGFYIFKHEYVMIFRKAPRGQV